MICNGLYGAVGEASDEQIVHLFETNVLGSLRVARAAMPFLITQGHGHIVQLSSMAGHTSNPSIGLYSASKWAVEGAFEGLAKEVASFNIKLTLVEPGGIRTEFFVGNAVFGQAMEPYQDHPVGQFIRAMKSGGSNMATGDPRKMAREIIRCVARTTACCVWPWVADSYRAIRESLLSRLARTGVVERTGLLY
ncbi:short chain dehydrogenase [Paenibacillus sophorae]|uniref:Short chain dehydrogenase n=1 Tax=Paenibacillus sophorae TaxID=1333845 RepID=A0A1H8FCE4_9BACL|nr:SDR family NAD(P)-dependent oxidoreductase [Paenibacillus sophorae]SEN29250.1 short chain dehydrogenase [Paenibacillus sophorae]